MKNEDKILSREEIMEEMNKLKPEQREVLISAKLSPELVHDTGLKLMRQIGGEVARTIKKYIKENHLDQDAIVSEGRLELIGNNKMEITVTLERRE